MCAVPGAAQGAAGANQMPADRQARFNDWRAGGGTDVGSWMRGELGGQPGKLVDIKEYQAPASSGSSGRSTASEKSPIAPGARRSTVLGGSGNGASPASAAATILAGATPGASGSKQLLGQ